MLLLTLRGTPTIYYGDEIGMHDVEIPPDRVQDPFEKNVPGQGLGRDPARTPMQWDAGPNAGFCPQDADPWLPVANDYRTYNVAAERTDQRSMLALHRRLLARERRTPIPHRPEPRARPDNVRFRRPREVRGRLVLSTHPDRDGEKVDHTLELRGDESVILELD